MKKYILLVLVFVTALTSCTNDDITISYATNFKINPATVIAPFTWEWEAGDLESFDTNYQLRVRLLVYNSDGILEKEDTQYFSNYSVVMNSSLALPNGSYTAIAITDVIGKTASAISEYWILKEHQKLADTHIDDAGYIGGQNKILGISKENVTIDGKNRSDISINVLPTGALFFVWYRNIHNFNDISRYTLSCAKTAESCLFNADGNYSVVAENHNGSYDWRIDYIDVVDYPNNTGVYNYFYVLPVSNLNLKFQATSSSETKDVSDVMTINPKAGEEWMFVLNLKDEESEGKITCKYGLANSAVQKSTSQIELGNISGQTDLRSNHQKIYLKNIK